MRLPLCNTHKHNKIANWQTIMNFSCPDCHELCDISSYTTHECPDRPLFRDYEYQVLRDYTQRYDGIAYPWAIVPTEMLLGSGYIKDIGATRRRRLTAGGYRDWGLGNVYVVCRTL